jgi:hypothetical protein
MYQGASRAKRNAVGPRLERGVRRRCWRAHSARLASEATATKRRQLRGRRAYRGRRRPARRLVEQNRRYPVFDKAHFIGSLSGLRSEPTFQRSERACSAEPRLKYNESDGGEMRPAKEASVYPRYAEHVARDDGQKASENEEDNAEMRK